MKTFIRRPGNKSKHLKHIIPKISNFTGAYIEPFVGSGAVLLALEPKKFIINDLNKDIISIWNLTKINPMYMINQIDKFKKFFLPLSNEDKLKICKQVVKKMNTYEPKKRAIMYLLMIYCSFNGSIVLNNRWYLSSLHYNIYNNKSCHIFTENYKKKLKKLNDYLKNGEIYSKDYKEILKKAKKGDFVFLDPPYIEEKKYAFQYNINEEFNLTQLYQEVKKLDSKKIKWMMTQIDTKDIRKIFKEYKFYCYKNSSNISKNKNLILKKELIITNY